MVPAAHRWPPRPPHRHAHLLHVQRQLHPVVQPGQRDDGVPLHLAAHRALPAVGQVVSHAPTFDLSISISRQEAGPCGESRSGALLTGRQAAGCPSSLDSRERWLSRGSGVRTDRRKAASAAPGSAWRASLMASPDWSHSRQVMASLWPELTECTSHGCSVSRMWIKCVRSAVGREH